MRELKVIIIVLLILIGSLPFISNPGTQHVNQNDTNEQNSRIDEIMNDNEDINLNQESKGSRGWDRGNTRGGCWLDSFEDDSRIESIYNLSLSNGNILLSNSGTIPNCGFENGTVGQVPDNWTNHIYFAGTGTGFYSNQIQLINTAYYSGSKALYAYLRGDERTSGYRVYMNITPTKPFINVSGARYAYIHIRDINYYHSYGWGWAVRILLQFFDGVNKYNTILLEHGESTPYANKYNFTSQGADGQTWYIYKREIPKNIDTSNLNFSILIYVNDWTSNSGYCDLSAIIDDIFFEIDISKTGYLISETINKPPDMEWDTLIINKTQPKNTYINLTILNATNNQLIPGSPKYVSQGEFDISYIDPIKYPSIKLKAEFKRFECWSPELHYWGVSWNASNAWHDTFFGGAKIGNKNNINSFDGKAQVIRNLTELKLDSNTVALWHFNEGGGITAFDETSYNNDGTLGGDGLGMDLPTWTNGKFGKGLSFDGINDYVLVPDKDELSIDNTGVLTIEFWVKTGSDITTRQDLICKGGQSTSGPWEWFIIIDNGKLKAIPTRGTTGGSLRIEEISITINSWHYVAVIFTGYTPNDDIEIYLNSVESSVFVQQFSNTYSNTNGDLGMGRAYGNSKWNQFSGILDEIRISKVKRTPQEIEDHYFDTKYSQRSILESNPISIPAKMYYDRLIINKSEPSDNHFNVTIFDDQTNTPIQGFENLIDTNVDLSSINPLSHPSIKLRGIFETNREDTPILYDWSVNWTRNTLPSVQEIITEPTVKRTDTSKIEINLTDLEDSEQNLSLQIEYKSPLDTNWQNAYLGTSTYIIDHWECTFGPTIDAKLGYYDFQLTITDSFDFYIHHESDLLMVVNNKPSQPTVEILPPNPRTSDELKVSFSDVSDVETPTNQLQFWYRWYSDNFYMQEYDNSTTIPASETVKDEIWRCAVYVHDGVDLGLPGLGETTIVNSPPELVEEFNNYMMFEDSIAVLEEKLTHIFDDPDNDTLEFRVTGQNKINTEIIQDNGTLKLIPDKDWFGTELLTFYANDTLSEVDETVQISVNPTNDLPKITQIGSQFTSPGYPVLDFTVKQNDWLNLTVQVEDIDGDLERGTIKFVLNITEHENYYFRHHDQSLIFNPNNEDVGWHYINISVTDNNDTPTQYVSQHIRIRVLNVNDPPTVEIITPQNNKEFLESDKITFTCLSDDIDFDVWNSVEELIYRWYTNRTELGDLGTKQNLTNVTLPPGFYNVTVEVKDVAGDRAYDDVQIKVKELPKKKSEPTTTTSLYLWLGIILVIIIIIICILLAILSLRKKKRFEPLGVPPEPVLQPDASYQPAGGLLAAPTIGRSAQIPQPQVISAAPMPGVPAPGQLGSPQPIALSGEPQPQLPAVQPTMAPPSPVIEAQAGIDARLSSQEKLVLLEERLVKGEIDQDVYLNLKAKFEMEAKPYTPPPQLPPSSGAPLQAPEITPIPTLELQSTSVEEQEPQPFGPQPQEAITPPAAVEPGVEPPPEVTEPEPPSDLPSEAYQKPQQPQIKDAEPIIRDTATKPGQTPNSTSPQPENPSEQQQTVQKTQNENNET